MNNNFYDIKKLAEKILYNSFWPTYIPNFYYWSSPEKAKEISKTGKDVLSKMMKNI